MATVQHWKLLSSQLVLDCQWCTVRQNAIALPDGTVIDDYFINVRPDIALVLPITPENELVLVRQYRHGVGEILLELPAGSFNQDEEDAQSAASRELQEETGYVAEELVRLATLYDNPVKDTNKIHLFLAKNARKLAEQQLDITEAIEVVLMPVEAVMQRILEGEICVSGTVAAILLGLHSAAYQQWTAAR